MQRWRLFLTTLACTSLLCLSPIASASTADATIKALQAQIQALSERLAALENGSTAVAVATPTPAPQAAQSASSGWYDHIQVKGDFRFRHEAFDIENSRDRHRQRFRSRVQMTAEVSDDLTAGVGLATGSDDPISTNQTFDDAGSSKNIVLDLAYINWQTPIDGMAVRAGKFKNPLLRVGGNGLIWDGDLNPEGVGMTYTSGPLFVNALASWLDESSSDDDSFLLGGQIGLSQSAGDDAKVRFGLGYYNYLDSRGEPAFYDGSALGNRLDADGNYISGFELLEGFVEYNFKLSHTGVTLFGDYVHNLDADDYDTAYAIGARLNGGRWKAGYTYQDVEADAVLGTWTDSDFIGGGTDGTGHILQASYALSKRVGLQGTLFLNERNVDFGTEEDFKRLMLDISFKY